MLVRFECETWWYANIVNSFLHRRTHVGSKLRRNKFKIRYCFPIFELGIEKSNESTNGESLDIVLDSMQKVFVTITFIKMLHWKTNIWKQEWMNEPMTTTKTSKSKQKQKINDKSPSSKHLQMSACYQNWICEQCGFPRSPPNCATWNASSQQQHTTLLSFATTVLLVNILKCNESFLAKLTHTRIRDVLSWPHAG